MAPSTTGFAYLIISLELGLFAWRFFQSWQKTEKEKREINEVGKWLFYFLSLFTVICFLAALGGLFFSQNTTILQGIVITTSFLLALSSATAAYLIFYLTIPKITPWYSFGVVLSFGLITTFLSVLFPFEPFLEVNGGINWDFHPPVNFLRFSLYLITFLPLSIIFIRQLFFSQDIEVKIKSLGMSLIFFFGLIISYIEFILEPTFQFPAITSDIFLILLGIIILGYWFFGLQLLKYYHPKY